MVVKHVYCLKYPTNMKGQLYRTGAVILVICLILYLHHEVISIWDYIAVLITPFFLSFPMSLSLKKHGIDRLSKELNPKIVE